MIKLNKLLFPNEFYGIEEIIINRGADRVILAT
jgi:hypothetical protein